MILLDSETFVGGLIGRGFTHMCVVPCSFASNLINACIAHPQLEYVPASSEAVACSIAAGLRMAGSQPLVISQSSGLTNMGSCITSLLKPYEIPLALLVSWRSYSAGDSEIQHQHLATELPALASAYGMPWELLDSDSIEVALSQLEQANKQGGILVLEKDTFSTVDLAPEYGLDLDDYPSRMAYLDCLRREVSDDVVIVGTTGNTARELYSIMPERRNFYMAGNMGGALSIGLGASLSGLQVLVCGGDAEATMHLGGLATAGRYRDRLGRGNLSYVLFDNESNKSTGGQRSYQEHLNYREIARHCNFSVYEQIVLSVDQFIQALKFTTAVPGPTFIHVKCSYDALTARPPAAAVKESQSAFLKRGDER